MSQYLHTALEAGKSIYAAGMDKVANINIQPYKAHLNGRNAAILGGAGALTIALVVFVRKGGIGATKRFFTAIPGKAQGAWTSASTKASAAAQTVWSCVPSLGKKADSAQKTEDNGDTLKANLKEILNTGAKRMVWIEQQVFIKDGVLNTEEGDLVGRFKFTKESRSVEFTSEGQIDFAVLAKIQAAYEAALTN